MTSNVNRNLIRLATRKSPLALWQAEHVRLMLESARPGLRVEVIPMVTEGDIRTTTTLASVGGKGLFMKELEQSLLAGEADIAVHSMKDVTVELPGGLVIAAACARGEHRDALVANGADSLKALPQGSRVGTSSLRRKSQLRHAFPFLDFVDLRGNVNTRLRRLDEGDYDAIVLAGAGLTRLGFSGRITELIDEEDCLPAVGQGIVGVECREDDGETRELLSDISDAGTWACLSAERSLNRALGGGCHVPIAGYATLRGQELCLRARVGDPDGTRLIMAEASGPVDEAEGLGRSVAAELQAQGAEAVLHSVYQDG